MVKKKASARRTRRAHNPAFKARVGLIWPPCERTRAMAELCEQFEVHPNQIATGRGGTRAPQPRSLALVPRRAGEPRPAARQDRGVDAEENDFLESALTKAGLLSAKP